MILTGKTRFRAGGWRGKKLVLQVELTGHYICPHSGSVGPEFTRWRDAEVQDLHIVYPTGFRYCAEAIEK